jgi:DNA-binding SARP family transcriptional activator
VHVRVVGRFAVERDGVVIDEASLGSRKGRSLWKLLAVRRGRMVPMDEIVEALWGDEPPAKAEANVATLVSRLRAGLGVDAIAGGRAGYRLGAGVTVDVDEAESLVSEAERRIAGGQPALARTAAARALATLTAGRVLEDEPGAEWALELQRAVDRLSRRARASAWRAEGDAGNHRAALAHAQAAVDADALDEEAHRAVILSYHRLGEQGEALRAYERLRTILRDELGADPGPETDALFGAVLRGEAVQDEGAATAPAEAVRGTSPDFVGRDAELAELLAIWSVAAAGRSSCALVRGDGGIGKSRLAAELAREVAATGAIVLRARCYETERSLFLQPVIELMRQAMATLGPEAIRRAAGDRARSLTTLVPELASVVGTDGTVGVTGEIERRRTFEAVAELLTGLARERPVLVVLDDLHEAGASTLELLHFALRWDPAAPVLLVATARNDDVDAVTEHLGSVASQLELAALSDAAIHGLAELAGVPDRAEEIARMTRGHTLFVVEALRALVDADDQTGPLARSVGLPPTLREAVTARARRCGPAVEELLRAAVVVGSSFDVSLLGELLTLPAETVVERAEPARRAGILVEAADGYEFSNDLIREILYATTPKPLRVVRHRRLVGLLADHPEAAAKHAAAAGDAALAVMHYRAAAERASEAFANREAEQLLTAALVVSGPDDEEVRAGLLLQRGRVRLALGRYGAAAADLDEAERVAHGLGLQAIEARALTERGWAAFHARNLVLASELAERASGMPESGERASILLGRVRNARGDLGASITLLRAVHQDAVEPALRAHALSCLGTALAHSDRYEEAMPVLDEAVVACRRTGVLRGLLNAQMFGAIVLANLGRFRTALTWADQLVADARRFDAAYYHPRALNSLAMIWRELGEPERATDLAEEALATARTPDGEVESEPAANSLLALAESAHLSGDDAQAARHLAEVSPLLTDRVAFGWRIELRRLELQARMERGTAEELLEQSRRHASAKYEALALSYLDRPTEALATAEATGSEWLVARVVPEPAARRHADHLAADLPPELRAGFVERGPLLGRFRRS